MDVLLERWRAAPLGELVWLDRAGRPDARPVVSLLERSHPALALTYAELEVARAIAAAPRLALAVGTAAHLAHDVLAAGVSVAVHDDPDGEGFAERLLVQELAKHPPSRRLADSILLRREHWWYVARLLVRVTHRSPTVTLGPGEILVAVAADGELELGVGRARGELTGDAHIEAAVPDGPAVALAHGADLPDLERPWWNRWYGPLRDGRLTIEAAADRAPRHGPMGLLGRWRAQTTLERACREGLRTAGHH